jgi:hypothetical protein
LARKFLMVSLACLSAMAFLVPTASATEMFEKVGTVGFQFLEIGAGPRGVAMGEAMVAAAEGIESLYWNPAGLRQITEPTVFFSYGTWPAEISHQFAGYAMRPGFIQGVFGLSVTALSMDPMTLRTATDPDGVGVRFDCGDIAIGATYARMFTDRFAAGGTLKWVHSGLGDLSVLGQPGLGDFSAETVLLDFGTLYDTGFRSLKIGLAVQNMGPEGTFIEEAVPVPTTFKFGVAMNVIETPGQRIVVSAEFRHPADTSEKINVGAEYSLNSMYFLRAGYKMNYDEGSFSAGAGARLVVGALGRIGLDYSYSDFGYLGAVHRMGLSAEF